VVGKSGWRELITARRRAVSPAVAAAEADALTGWLRTVPLGDTVCAYLPMRTEPGTAAMLDALLARRVTVLLPVIDGVGPLNWAPYAGELRAGPFGVREPSTTPLGVAAIIGADTVLVPALAVDRRGVRLGKGGGYYDRSLGAARGKLVAVVRDDELVDELPAQPHDIPMHAVLRPRDGLREL
jgi:5-formyltetrahydrofolate cyclo-ligase